MLHVSKGIHEALFARCLGAGVPVERLRCVYNGLELSERFVAENMYREEMQAIVGASK